MATQSPARRYAVVQEKEEIKNEIVEAIRAHRNAKLDLIDESGVQHVSFRINTTDHTDPERALFIGVTLDHRTINLYIEKDGEAFVLLPD